MADRPGELIAFFDLTLSLSFFLSPCPPQAEPAAGRKKKEKE
jgi:hypothetical protein